MRIGMRLLLGYFFTGGGGSLVRTGHFLSKKLNRACEEQRRGR